MTHSKNTPHYHSLTEHFQKIAHFEHLSALGDWDQATMMPLGGSESRGAAMAELARHIHELKTEPFIETSIEQAEEELLNSHQISNLREIRYQFMQANVVPADLVQAKTQLAYRCEHAWRDQRKNNDWQGFKPNLEALMKLVREEASIRAQAQDLSPYDALLNKFEPGMTTARLELLFGDLKSWLPGLIETVQGQQKNVQPIALAKYSAHTQEALGRDVMKYLGFDFNQGRLDVSSHPFCGGVPGDIRLTTRYDEADFTSGLMGIVHETGHARYEQGLPKEWRGQPAGGHRSMAIHESQSLFCEMQLGRGKGFLTQIQPKLQQHLGSQLSIEDLSQIYTRVKPGLIRVDADEVTYPCHILLRFEAEKGLVDGSLSVADLPDFWTQQMQSLLGIDIQDDYRNGCMQDIHWAVGELGYFPSYTLGAMYAAQFRYSMEASLGSVDDLLAQGKIELVFDWLDKNIWSQGSLLTTDELVKHATGETLNPKFFRRHLEQRYLK
ncbi:carboxypeptidase M32 [Shewanella eurypsychrophilus]|uniref:Metal-dependent carboxypeptidase n=1 Tax=Shewanella eurypsychrophilus TaxID=2593656 RepID=A0ABX6V2T6_9GAMM|nr:MULTISPECIES: carboxypeptidase M32 [Shewanella]QFU21598.1 carboxypeptidase M32 [Shewanella sp. YLB-09]QPG56888.1 carboxypeptidase M32 [Shewanella eurypsychrophilus]